MSFLPAMAQRRARDQTTAPPLSNPSPPRLPASMLELPIGKKPLAAAARPEQHNDRPRVRPPGKQPQHKL